MFRFLRSTRESSLYLFLTGAVLLLSILPVGRLFLECSKAGSLADNALFTTLQTSSTWTATFHSLLTSTLGCLVAVILGGGFAYLVGLSNIHRKGLLVFCFMLPMMIPPQITALSWIQLLGPSSPVLITLGLAPPLGTPHPLYSVQGIILLLGIQQAPLVYLALRGTLRALPKEVIEAARCSGAGTFTAWKDHILPLSSPGLIAGGGIAFVSSLGNFGIPAMLGIPFSYLTLPTLIYQKFTDFGPGMISSVASLAILIAIIAVISVGLQNYLLKNRDYRLLGFASQPLDFDLGRWCLPVELLIWLFLFFVLALPLLALVASSLVPAYGVALTFDTASITSYIEVLFHQDATRRAFTNSFLLASGAAVLLLTITLPMGFFSFKGRSRLASGLAMVSEIPYALPGMVLGVSCILLFVRPLPFVGVSIYSTIFIIFFAYLSRFMAVSFKPIAAGISQLDPSLDEAAASCGAAFFQRLYHIYLPLITPSAAAAVVMVFLSAFNELTLSALLWSSGNETLGIIIFKAISEFPNSPVFP